jgi:hypothetical protein
MIVGSDLVHGRQMHCPVKQTFLVMVVLGVMFNNALFYSFGSFLLCEFSVQYGPSTQLLFTDTDSLCYSVIPSTQDVYQDMMKDKHVLSPSWLLIGCLQTGQ